MLISLKKVLKKLWISWSFKILKISTCRFWDSRHFAVCAGSHTVFLFEGILEVIAVGKTALLGNVADRQFRIEQQFRGPADPEPEIRESFTRRKRRRRRPE